MGVNPFSISRHVCHDKNHKTHREDNHIVSLVTLWFSVIIKHTNLITRHTKETQGKTEMMSSLVSWWFSVVIKHSFDVTTETNATPRETDMMSSLVSLWLCAVIRITSSLLILTVLAEVGDSSATFILPGRSG